MTDEKELLLNEIKEGNFLPLSISPLQTILEKIINLIKEQQNSLNIFTNKIDSKVSKDDLNLLEAKLGEVDKESQNRDQAIEANYQNLKNDIEKLINDKNIKKEEAAIPSQNYDNQISDHQAQIDNLNSKINDQNQKIGSLYNYLSEINKHLNEDDQKISNIENQFQDLSEKYNQLNNSISDLHEQIEGTNKKFTDQDDQLNNSISSLNKQIEDLNKKFTDQGDQLNNSISSLKKQIEDLNKKSIDHDNQLSSLNSKLDSNKNQIDNHEERIKSIEIQNDALKDSIEGLKAENKSFLALRSTPAPTDDNQEKGSNLPDYTAAIMNLQDQINQQRDSLRNANSLISSHTNRLDDIENSLSNIKSSPKPATKDEIENLNQELNNIKDLINNFKQPSKEEKPTNQTNTKDLEEKIRAIQQEFEKLRNEVNQNKQTKPAPIQAKAAPTQAFQDSNMDIKNELDSLGRKLVNHDKEISQIKDKIGKLENSIESKSDSIRERNLPSENEADKAPRRVSKKEGENEFKPHLPTSESSISSTPNSTIQKSPLPDLPSPTQAEHSKAISQLRTDISDLTQKLTSLSNKADNLEKTDTDHDKRISDIEKGLSTLNNNEFNQKISQLERSIKDHPDKDYIERLFDKFKSSMNNFASKIPSNDTLNPNYASADEVKQIREAVKKMIIEQEEAACVRKSTFCLSCGQPYKTCTGAITDTSTSAILGAAPISVVANDTQKPCFVYGTDHELYYSSNPRGKTFVQTPKTAPSSPRIKTPTSNIHVTSNQ